MSIQFAHETQDSALDLQSIDMPQAAPSAPLPAGTPGLRSPRPLCELEEQESEQPWPIAGLLPEGLCLLSSTSPASARSLALQLALAIACQIPALDQFPTAPGQVLYLSFHEHEQTFVARARHLLGGATFPAALAFSSSGTPWLEQSVDALRSCLRDFPQTRLIVLDSLSSLFPPDRFWSSRRKQALLNQLNRLAHEQQCCLLVLHSQARCSRRDPFSAIACPPLLLEAIEHLFVLEHQRTHPQAVLHLSGSLMQPHQLKLRLPPNEERWQLSEAQPTALLTPERRAVLQALHTLEEPLCAEELAITLSLDVPATRLLLSGMQRAGLLLRDAQQRYRPLIPVPAS